MINFDLFRSLPNEIYEFKLFFKCRYFHVTLIIFLKGTIFL